MGLENEQYKIAKQQAKGQISLDLLLTVIIFAILFAGFFAFAEVGIKNIDSLRNDSGLVYESSKIRPLFASAGLPPEYNLIYSLECTGYSFFSEDDGYYVSANGAKKFIAKEKLDDYFCNTEMYFTK